MQFCALNVVMGYIWVKEIFSELLIDCIVTRILCQAKTKALAVGGA